MVGPQRQRARISRRRLRRAPAKLPAVAEVQEGVGKIRLQMHSGLVGGYGVGMIAQRLQRDAESEVSIR